MLLGSFVPYALVGAGVLILVIASTAACLHNKARKLAPWKQLRNNLTQDEVTALLGKPRRITPLDNGENWDYGRRPHEATVMFTDGRVTGFIKPF